MTIGSSDAVLLSKLGDSVQLNSVLLGLVWLKHDAFSQLTYHIGCTQH